jgi:hypothetical protein
MTAIFRSCMFLTFSNVEGCSHGIATSYFNKARKRLFVLNSYLVMMYLFNYCTFQNTSTT